VPTALTPDFHGRVVWANQAAEAVLGSNDGLSVRDGRLSRVDRGDDRRLHEAVRAAAVSPVARVRRHAYSACHDTA